MASGGLTPVVLLGRDREREAIVRALESARGGTSATLALVGEAGIGKTALLDHAAERAAGMRVLRARGIESEAQIPFASLLELLRPALGVLDRIPQPQEAALEGALALRPVRPRSGSRSGRPRSACWRPMPRRARWRSWSTMPIGSTARARRRCCSRSAG